jgi:hypothetical protein
MENVIIFIAVPILILICYLIFINQRILNKVVTYKKDEQKLKINDERYYELNNKIQLIIVISSIILLLSGFFGYNTISTIKSEINNEIGNYRETISSYDSIIKKYNKLILELESDRGNLSKNLQNAISETNRLQKELMQLQSDYSFNVRTYIVSNIKIESKKIEATGKYDTVRVYFKDLKTTKGESLPKFRTPPYLNIQNLGFAFAVMIKKVTTEYFEYEFNELVGFDEKTGKEEPLFPITNFDLLITINK